MIVTKSTGETRITITLTEPEAKLVRRDIEWLRTWTTPTDLVRRLLTELDKALTPPPPKEVCCALVLGRADCGKPAVTKWKVTCINDRVRTNPYCTQHGGTRDAVEQLNCSPCKNQGSYHKVVGVAEVKL